MIQRPTLPNFAKFIAFFTLSLSAQTLFAVEVNTSEEEAVTWYQVEVLLFKNNKEYKQDQNDIPLNLPSSETQYVLVKTDPMVASQLKRLPNSSLRLNKSFTAMTRSKEFEVLEFAGWKQPLIKNQKGIPLTIKAGEQFGEHYELEGQLTFRKNRYLHVKTDLYMASYEEGTNTNLQKWLLEDTFSASSLSSITGTGSNIPETLPVPAEVIIEQSETITDDSETHSTDVETGAFSATEEKVINYIASNIAHMNETRRMRSGEIHFLDHPKFGVLVTIEPTDPPFVYNEPSESPSSNLISPAGEH